MKRFIVPAFLMSFFIFLSCSASGEEIDSKVEIQAPEIRLRISSFPTIE